MSLNMRILKRSRKAPRAGDVFVLKILKDRYHFGRVIRTDTHIGFWDNVILIYLYKDTSSSKLDLPELNKNRLLIPPQGIDRAPWVRGYFETIAHSPITKADVLRVHCFCSPGSEGYSGEKYYDDEGRRLRRRIEPCGVFGLGTDGTIDDEMSDALGIPRCPESVAEDKRREEALKRKAARWRPRDQEWLDKHPAIRKFLAEHPADEG